MPSPFGKPGIFANNPGAGRHSYWQQSTTIGHFADLSLFLRADLQGSRSIATVAKVR